MGCIIGSRGGSISMSEVRGGDGKREQVRRAC